MEFFVTVGRRKRKRKPGAGKGVRTKPHTRTPRGADRGKARVRVDGYHRGSPAKDRKKRKKK